MRPIHGADTPPLSLLVLRDVTRLKELDRLKSEFVATVSHELRTPLTGTGMSLALLREGVAPQLDEQQRELLEVADEEVARLKRLVEELLDVSKIEAGRIELSFPSVPLADLLTQVEKAFASQVRYKGVSLSATADDSLPDVRVDANKIAWVLANLVGNALRYVDAGGHIRLSAQRKANTSRSPWGTTAPACPSSCAFATYILPYGSASHELNSGTRRAGRRRGLCGVPLPAMNPEPLWTVPALPPAGDRSWAADSTTRQGGWQWSPSGQSSKLLRPPPT